MTPTHPNPPGTFEVVTARTDGHDPRPEPWEIGAPKDTVTAYPGEITRVKAYFDIAGRYVWHCHIVEHEDNEMMRPYDVVKPLAQVSFLDVPSAHRFHEAIQYLAGREIVEGYDGDLFGPEDAVKRAQMAKMTVLALGTHNVATTNLGSASFPDVAYTGQPYPFDYVEEAAGQEIVEGYVGGLFGPFDDITRIQMLRMVVRAGDRWLVEPPAGYDPGFIDLAPADEALVAKAEFNNLIDGTTPATFEPYAPATRGHVAQVIYKAMLLHMPMPME